MRKRDLLAVAATLLVAGYAIAPPPPLQAPRLVGYGCEGAAGPIYAIEESDFPRCAAIEGIEK